jgi:adenosylcobinamide-phosphate synthase
MVAKHRQRCRRDRVDQSGLPWIAASFPMSLLPLIFALLLEQVRAVDPKGLPFKLHRRYAALIAGNFNAGRRRHGVLGWIMAVLPWVLLVDGIHYLLAGASVFLALVWSTAVLYFTMGLRQFSSGFAAVQSALREGRQDEARRLLAGWSGEDTSGFSDEDVLKVTLEHGLVSAHRNVFGVMAWHAFLPAVSAALLPGTLGVLLAGPGGAVLYRLSSMVAQQWGGQAGEEDRAFSAVARDLFSWLDWVPARLTALSFAVVGDFEDALYAWRAQAASWVDRGVGVILASGAGALGVRLGDSLHVDGRLVYRPELGLGDMADQEHLNSAVGLIWRSVVLWLMVMALVTVANWVR